MTGIRASAVRIVSVIAGLVLPLAMVAPAANADPIADIRGTVTKDRANAHCPDLKYNQTLQDIAFASAAPIPQPDDKINGMKAAYGGDVKVFVGTGDHMDHVVNVAYQNGAGPAIGDCSNTDYGVSFIRNEAFDVNDYGPDFVGIVLGKAKVGSPGGAAPAGGGPGQGTTTPATKGCPDGSSVLADQECPVPPKKCPPGGPQAEVPAGQVCPPPTNAVSVTFDRGITQWTVNVKNSAGIGGSCTYTATSDNGLPGANRTFNISANGNQSFTVPAPAPFTSYHVVTSCTGTYDGQQVEFGHNEQDVSL
jgi:hypothetical protein